MNQQEKNIYCIVRTSSVRDLAWVKSILTELFWDGKLPYKDYGKLFDNVAYSPKKFTNDYDWSKSEY